MTTTPLQAAIERVGAFVARAEFKEAAYEGRIVFYSRDPSDCIGNLATTDLQTLLDTAREAERLRAEVEHLRFALKPRVANISEDQLLAAWAAWDDCHDGGQAENPMRAALEASHLVFVRRALQIADAAIAASAEGEPS